MPSPRCDQCEKLLGVPGEALRETEAGDVAEAETELEAGAEAPDDWTALG